MISQMYPHVRRWRWAVVCLASAWSGAMAAHGAAYVSNLAQPYEVEFSSIGIFAHASSFTTDSGRYQLDGVTLALRAGEGAVVGVALRADNGGQPGALLHDLGDQSLAVGPSMPQFVASNFELLPHTTYWVSVGESGDGVIGWDGTSSMSQSSLGAWTIGDDMFHSNNSGTAWTPTFYGPPNEAPLFSVEATLLSGDQAFFWTAGGGVNSSAPWGSAANWDLQQVPDNPIARVTFPGDPDSAHVVVLNGSRSVGRVVFDDGSNAYTVSNQGFPGSALTLTGSAVIEAVGPGGFHILGVPIVGNSGLVKRGIGTIILDSGASAYSGETRVEQGTLQLRGVKPLGESAKLTIVGGASVDVTHMNEYLVRAGQTVTGAGEIYFNRIALDRGSRLAGNLTLFGDELFNNGRIAPGVSPGIITIFGDYSQESNGILEVEVGGLTPGTQHDQLVVSNVAALDGRLEAQIINGFQPVPGTAVDFLRADQIVGGFRSFVVPGLPTDLSATIEFAAVGPNEVGRLRFLASSNDIQFDATGATAFWDDDATWRNVADPGNDRFPDRRDNVVVRTLATSGQTIELTGAQEVNRLTIGGAPNDPQIVLNIDGGIEATSSVLVRNNGVAALGGGTLSSAAVQIQGGGALIGNGDVVGDLTVGDNTGAVALLSPGVNVGVIDVAGAYVQKPTGELKIEVDSLASFDRVRVTGDARLGGTLTFDLSNAPNLAPGTIIEIMTAQSILGASEFENVRTIGTSSVTVVPRYVASGPGGPARVFGESHPRGDLNFDFVFDPNNPDAVAADAAALALAFVNPVGYRTTYGREGWVMGRITQEDEFFDFDDISAFRQLVGMSAAQMQAYLAHAQGVPEPGAAALAALVGVPWMGRRSVRGWRRRTIA